MLGSFHSTTEMRQTDRASNTKIRPVHCSGQLQSLAFLYPSVTSLVKWMAKWTWEVPSLSLSLCFFHGLAPCSLCQGGCGLENWAFSPSSYWRYFSLLPFPSANGCEAMLKDTSKSWSDFRNFTAQLSLFYFLFWSQTISVHQLTVRLHKYLCHIGNKTQSYGNNLKARYFIFWSHNLLLGWKTDHWIELVYK